MKVQRLLAVLSVVWTVGCYFWGYRNGVRAGFRRCLRELKGGEG